MYTTFYSHVKRFHIRFLCDNPNTEVLSFIETRFGEYLNDSNDYFISKIRHKNIFNYIKDRIYFNLMGYRFLFENPHNIEYIKRDINVVNEDNFKYLCRNPHPFAIEFIKKNIHLLKPCDMFNLCCNKNKNVIPIIKENLHKMESNSWIALFSNEHAFEIIEQNYDKLGDKENHLWNRLASNTNLNVIEFFNKILTEDEEKISGVTLWFLGQNQAIKPLFLKHADKLSTVIFSNPNIFEYDYEFLKIRREQLHEELMSVIYQPDNFEYIKS